MSMKTLGDYDIHVILLRVGGKIGDLGTELSITFQRSIWEKH